MNRSLAILPAALCALALAEGASAFCGFYVSKADAKLFNKASQVVLVREGDRTTLTMVNDYQGDPKEFAVVVPVPTFIQREQIDIVDKAIVEHLDAYSAPRLVEYFDENPCAPKRSYLAMRMNSSVAQPAAAGRDAMKGLGVTIEAEYAVGEYDILILSAEQSDGLETWLLQNSYKIPAGAAKVLESYIKQKMRFFVAKVNLGEQGRLGFSNLRPLRVSFESPKFMLPIRLGTVNANGPQELFIYALSRKGRIETVNYRTVKLPTGMDIPLFVKTNFADFYRAMFAEQVRREDMRVVFQEYAWDMGWCDPCAADPLSNDELGKLGVTWLGEAAPVNPPIRRQRFPGGPQSVYVTRLHVRYDAAHFPDDLVFQETADRSNFQGRYVLRHAWKGSADCPAAKTYFEETLPKRLKDEAQTLANLTGWDLQEIHRKAGIARAR
jgi:hypothetical protein